MAAAPLDPAVSPRHAAASAGSAAVSVGSAAGSAARGVAAVAAADPGRTALVSGGRTTTYAELDGAANGAAWALASLGVGPGDRVAVRAPNGPEHFFATNGIARLGALVVPVSWRLVADEIAYLLEDSGAAGFVHDGSAAALEASGRLGVPSVSLDDPGLFEPRPEPPTPDYLAAVVTAMSYTSGTTGRPKGIERPAPAPATVAPPAPFAAFWGFSPSDVHLLCGPAYHTAPGAYAQMTLVEGGAVVVMERFSADDCLQLIERHRVTTTHMVPANFVRILEADWAAHDRSSVRLVLHAAAPCPVAVKRRILEVFPPGTVFEYYGASEGMATVCPPDEWLARPGTVGRPFPGLQVRIYDETGAPCPPGVVGAVYVSSFGSARFSYHRAPDKTASAWHDGYFTVGDLGHLDEDGYLFLADRRSDLVISGGVNIYPAEVEAALVADDDVVDAVCFGVPDERMGQTLHAMVELRPGADADADALLARVGAHLAAFKLPRSVELVAHLERDPNGKVSRARLRDAWVARHQPASAHERSQP